MPDTLFADAPDKPSVPLLGHWTELRSTNPLERVNKEIGRRIESSGSSPTTPS